MAATNLPPDRSTRYQIATGGLSVLLLAFGLVNYARADAPTVYAGFAIRIGAVLAVIALAMPQLQQLRAKLPSIVSGIALFVLVTFAARPRIGGVLLALLVVLSGLAWLSKFTRQARR